MITTHFYLDARRVAAGVPAPLRISIASRGTRALIPLNVTLLPSQWDASKQIVVAHPCRQQINSMLAEQKCEIDAALFRLSAAGELQGLNAAGIKQRVLAVIRPEESYAKSGTAFLPRFDAYVSRLSPGAARIYGFTRSRLARYLGDGLGTLTFEDVGVDWLHGFDEFLSHTAPSRNSRNIHFRNIRAVFNDALDDEVITCYPFRRFRLKYEPTRKRSLSVDRLRSLFSAEVEDWERRYLDCFKLIFCLCGINIVDLCRLEAVTDGRVEYVRAKTHRLYSIKVEPEAQEIIGRYRGRAHLLCYDDNGTTYRYFYNRLREGLNRIGERLGIHGLSTYWARHSWATIAASLDIPKETIAAALGHGGNSVTDIYIDFDRSKIDDANRRVLDWVLYGKR